MPPAHENPIQRRAALMRLGLLPLLPAMPWALSACGGGSNHANPEKAPTEASVAQAIAHLHALVPQWLQRTGVPGAAIAVVYQGKVRHTAGYGLRRIDASDRIDADTVFQLASLSKPIGATVMAAHMGSKTGLSWDTPIQQLMPDFSLAYPDASFNARLTLGDLYAHRSGLPDHAGDTLEDLGYTRAEILQRLRWATLHDWGQYDYTNFGLTAAAQAMSRAQGQDWADLSASSLYQPLGMQHSSSRFSDFAAQQNRAWGHVQKDLTQASYGAFPASYLVQQPQRQADAQSPAGGVSSCANDLALWMNMVLAGGQIMRNGQSQQLIDPAALQAALTARPGGNYGYGFNIGADPYGHASISHSGAFILGAATAFILWPQAQLGIAVLTNAQPRGLAEGLALRFGQYAWGEVTQDEQATDWLAAMQGKMQDLYRPQGQFAGLQPPSKPNPPQSLNAYAGSYSNDYWGDAQIAIQPSATGQVLELRLGATPIHYPLQHWDGDTFVFAPHGESFAPNSVSAVQFSAGQMHIELLHEDLACGVFRRV